MKSISLVPLACLMFVASCVHIEKNTTSSSSMGGGMETKPPVATPPTATTTPPVLIPASQPAMAGAHKVGETFPVSAGVISAPFVLTNGCIFQEEQLDIPTGGKAVYNFNITDAGKYVIKGMVNAPSDGENSFYVNVDAMPEEDLMIWGMDVTTDFEERTVSWRGEDETVPKVFNLGAGGHKLIIVGREPNTELKSLTIVPAP